MSTRGVADVVFCLDASASMEPCIEGVKAHIGDFVEGLGTSSQVRWDLRLDFVAHSAGERLFQARTAFEADAVAALYGAPQPRLFTPDVRAFRDALSTVRAEGNEASLVALDCCLDFPWRPAAGCHRVVVLMTDEPFEGGTMLAEQEAKLDALVDKLQRLRVILHLVGPPSEVFDRLAAAPRSEYQAVEAGGTGLANVDFKEVLSAIGKSVSASALQAGSASAPRGLFGQAAWRSTESTSLGPLYGV
jgi:hypothetical protein